MSRTPEPAAQVRARGRAYARRRMAERTRLRAAIAFALRHLLPDPVRLRLERALRDEDEPPQ